MIAKFLKIDKCHEYGFMDGTPDMNMCLLQLETQEKTDKLLAATKAAEAATRDAEIAAKRAEAKQQEILKSSNEKSVGFFGDFLNRLNDPPGYRNLSDREVCIKHFTNKANDDGLNEMLSDAAIKKRNLDCSVYAAEENNILLKKELNKKIKCWSVDGYTRCYTY